LFGFWDDNVFDPHTGEPLKMVEPYTGQKHPKGYRFDPKTGQLLFEAQPVPPPVPQRKTVSHSDEIHANGVSTKTFPLHQGDAVSIVIYSRAKGVVFYQIEEGGAQENIEFLLTATNGNQVAQFKHTGPVKKDRDVDCFFWEAVGTFETRSYSGYQYKLISNQPVNVKFIVYHRDERCTH
jgi:hypothetical protein